MGLYSVRFVCWFHRMFFIEFCLLEMQGTLNFTQNKYTVHYTIDWLHSQVYTVCIFDDIFAWKKRLRELKWPKISQAFHTSYFNFAKCMRHPKIWEFFMEYSWRTRKKTLGEISQISQNSQYIFIHTKALSNSPMHHSVTCTFSCILYSFESMLDRVLFI